MKKGVKDGLKCAATATTGGALGAGTYAVIGGLGLAGMGTAVGITLGPFIAIGASIGGLGYGLYWLGKQAGRSSKGDGDSVGQAEK